MPLQGTDTSSGRSLRLALHSPTNSLSNVNISHCNRLALDQVKYLISK